METAELEIRISQVSGQRAALVAYAEQLDAAIAEVDALVAEVDQRISAQRDVVSRRQHAAGELLTFGTRNSDRVRTVNDGRGTVQLSGPRPPDTVGGQFDQAQRVLSALEAEAEPVHVSRRTLAMTRQQLDRPLAALAGELNGLLTERAQLETATAERAALIGERLTWRTRLIAILGRLAARGDGRT